MFNSLNIFRDTKSSHLPLSSAKTAYSRNLRYRRIFVLIFHNHVNSCSCSIIHFIPGNVLEANAFGDCTTTFWIPLGILKTTLFWGHLCLFSTTASPHSLFICRQIKAPTLLNFAFSYVLIYSPLSQFVFPIFP